MPRIEIVRLDDIEIPARHSRSKTGAVDDLVNSIISTGAFNSSLSLKRRRDGQLVIICGVLRYQAMCQATENDHEFTPVISAIIYDEDELDPVMERKLALDENRLHRPLPPVDEAKAVVELRLVADCLAMRETLEGREGWDENEMPQSLKGWRSEYERLSELAHQRDSNLGTKTSVTWKQIEQYLGISEAKSKQMRRLAYTPKATQEALLDTSLSKNCQLAITLAPAERQVELVEATQTVGYTPASVIRAAALVLKSESGANHSAVEVLELAHLIYQVRPRLSRAELSAEVRRLLIHPELVEHYGSSDTGDREKLLKLIDYFDNYLKKQLSTNVNMVRMTWRRRELMKTCRLIPPCSCGG